MCGVLQKQQNKNTQIPVPAIIRLTVVRLRVTVVRAVPSGHEVPPRIVYQLKVLRGSVRVRPELINPLDFCSSLRLTQTILQGVQIFQLECAKRVQPVITVLET